MRTPRVHFRLYRSEVNALLRLALPIVFGQLGIMLMGVADTVQVGHMARDAKLALDAAGVANGVWITVAILGQNTLGVIAPLISKANEERDRRLVARLVRTALRVALLAGLGCAAVLVVLAFRFSWFGQHPAVEALASPYLLIVTASTLPLFFFLALRQLTDGLGHTRVAMSITLGAVLLNVGLNHLLINGVWIFPEWGLNGAGVATLVCRTGMALAMTVYVLRTPRFRVFLKTTSLGGAYNPNLLLRKVLSIGIPSGFQGFFEIAVFAFAALMVGWLGENQLAAHVIAINPASVTYMMVTGLAAAGGIRVGAGLGQRDRTAVLKSGTTALALGGLFMGVCCLLFLFANEQIVALYIRDREVAPIAARLVFIAGFFQLFDGIQAVSLGLLRGMADVNLPTVVTLVAYWVVGLPIGALLTFGFNLDVTGIWLGLTAGLMAAAVLLSWRFLAKARKLTFAPKPVGAK